MTLEGCIKKLNSTYLEIVAVKRSGSRVSEGSDFVLI